LTRRHWRIGAAVAAVYGLSEAVRWYMEQLPATSLPLWGVYGALSAVMLIGAYHLTISVKRTLPQILLFAIAAAFLMRTVNSATAIYQFSSEIVDTVSEEETSPDLIEV